MIIYTVVARICIRKVQIMLTILMLFKIKAYKLRQIDIRKEYANMWDSLEKKQESEVTSV